MDCRESIQTIGRKRSEPWGFDEDEDPESKLESKFTSKTAPGFCYWWWDIDK